MKMKPAGNVFDYAIIGAGAAGLQLALTMLEDVFFKDKKVALFDKDSKSLNDRTWCYWEKGRGKYDDLLFKSWSTGLFFSKTERVSLDLAPYTYKMLRSARFYEYAKQRIGEARGFTWIQQEVLHLHERGDEVCIETAAGNYSALQVFDSRIAPAFYADKKSTKIVQHFKGWIIESEEPVFDPEKFVMMDFRFAIQGTTSFIYLLPFTANKALVEFTFFSPELVAAGVYEEQLKKYLEGIPRMKSYTISETESGIIPMSDYNFQQHQTRRITKIGTAGAWVKASTGYSFHNGTLLSGRIAETLKNGQSASCIRSKRRFRFYDQLFLNVLFHQNGIGEEIFGAMYTKNRVGQIFRFLDEETRIWEELRIINSFPYAPFLKALFRKYVKWW